MDNYEVNVLTRKGGWKKLPQEIVKEDKDTKSKNLAINVNDIDEQELALADEQSDDGDNLFEKFSEISIVINKLRSIETEKSGLLEELNKLEGTFQSRKKELDTKIDNIKNEYNIYQKAIDLIKSLKNV